MSNIKERILGALTVMSEADALKIWLYIENNYKEQSWEDIEEVEPTPEEIAILDAYENGDPEYQAVMTHEELLKELGIDSTNS